MAISRNDKCPCRSGKKYKKCCLNKKEAATLSVHRSRRIQENFEHDLITIQSYVKEVEGPKVYAEALEQFNQQVGMMLQPQELKRHFLYYVTLVRPVAGERNGVAAYMKAHATKATSIMKEVAELDLQLLQYVDNRDGYKVVRDCVTGEEHLLNVPFTLPHWSVFVGLLYPTNEANMNLLVSVVLSPQLQAMDAYKDVVAKRTSIHEAYLQLITDGTRNLGRSETRVVTLNREVYEILSPGHLSTLLAQTKGLIVDAWNEKIESGRFTLIGDTYVYEDSLNSESVKLTTVLGAFRIANRELVFEQMNEDVPSLRTNWEDWLPYLRLKDTQVQEMTVPKEAILRTFVTEKGNKTQQEFLMMAQQYAIMNDHIELPLWQCSLNDLHAQNRVDDLRVQHEIFEYSATSAQEYVEGTTPTPDFNYERRKHHVVASPFVTGGAERKTSLTHVPLVTEEKAVVTNVEVAENVSNVETGDVSYTADWELPEDIAATEIYNTIVAFFKDKAEGKSKATVSKYRSVLRDILYVCHAKNIATWEQFKQHSIAYFHWDSISVFEKSPSPSYFKNFFSIWKALAKFADANGAEGVEVIVKREVQDIEKERVAFAEWVRDVEFAGSKERLDDVETCYIQLQDASGSIITFKEVGRTDKVVRIEMDEKWTEALPKDAVLQAKVGKDDSEQLRLEEIEQLYTDEVLTFL